MKAIALMLQTRFLDVLPSRHLLLKWRSLQLHKQATISSLLVIYSILTEVRSDQTEIWIEKTFLAE
jgi:hypothetical protein